MTKREELIEAVTKALVDDAWEGHTEELREHHLRLMALRAVQVFEQAHTATDDERDLDAFQKIAGVLYRDKVQEVEAFQHTPTDDEREAPEAPVHYGSEEAFAWQAGWEAGANTTTRRTVQGEPTDDELLDVYRTAVNRAMDEASARDGFASNMSRESIVAGLRAVQNGSR